MNSADIAVLAVVAALVLLAVGIMWRNRKKGRRSCGCQCPGCTGACGKGPASKKP